MNPVFVNSPAPHFVKFELQRCIRICEQNGEYCLPIDPRQRDEVLAPVADYDQLNVMDSQRIALVETRLEGVEYAALDTRDGELFGLAYDATEENPDYNFTDGTYGGVVWALFGYFSAHNGEPILLHSGSSESAVRELLQAFNAMLATQRTWSSDLLARRPGRVVVDMTGGAIHAVYAEQPIDIAFISHDPDDLDDHQAALGHVAPDGHPVAIWRQQAIGSATATAELIAHYFAPAN